MQADVSHSYTCLDADGAAFTMVVFEPVAVGESEGFVKLLFNEPHGELVGAHIIGADATEMIAEANKALGANGYTPSGSVDRPYQEALKNALDRANNNINFVVSLAGWHDTNGNNVIDPGEI